MSKYYTLEFTPDGDLKAIHFEGFTGEECKTKMKEIADKLAKEGIKVDIERFLPHVVTQVKEKARVATL